MKVYAYIVKDPKITSSYGTRKDPITGKKSTHHGIDVVSNIKDRNIYAIDDGYVQKVVTGQDKSTTGYGNYIWVRYPRYNLSILVGHCSKIMLKKGDKVKKGTIYAIMGSTGKSTGVHAHIGMTRIGSDTWLDPIKFDIIPDKYNLTRLLKKGCKGNDVLELQKELNKREFNCGKEDKIFGIKVKNATKNFQKANKLFADGIVGKNTAHKLGWLYKNK